jgi:hypothetical protein
MIRFGDAKQARPFRRYALVWLPQDDKTPVTKPRAEATDYLPEKNELNKNQSGKQIATAYAEIKSRYLYLFPRGRYRRGETV